MCHDPFVISVYVLSQLLNKWIDPVLLKNQNDLSDEIFAWSPVQWVEYYKCKNGENTLQSNLIAQAIEKKNLSISDIAYKISNHIQKMHKHGGKVISYFDPEYPDLLKVIKDPPLCINVLGDYSLLSTPMVTVVGSRKACHRALFESEKIGFCLAEHGVTVVSGGAYGCDIAVHKGTLTTGLSPVPAIVVFAGGLGTYYPVGNLAMFRELAERKALFISERLWGIKPFPCDFPIRNRIVSGLSSETIVMQCGQKSGAMITAKLALDQGRDVSVLSFSEDDLSADGNVALIEDGASSFTHAEDWFDSTSGVSIV